MQNVTKPLKSVVKRTAGYQPRYRSENPVWRFFTRVSGIPVCIICSKRVVNGYKSFAQNTSNLRNHLRRNHPECFEELARVSEEERVFHQDWQIIEYKSVHQFLLEICEKFESFGYEGSESCYSDVSSTMQMDVDFFHSFIDPPSLINV